MSNRLKFGIILTIITSMSLSIFLIFQIKKVMAESHSINKTSVEANKPVIDEVEKDEPGLPKMGPHKPDDPKLQVDKPKKQTPPEEKNISNPENEKVAYLTFDDGPSLNTLKVLEILKENNIKATFFVTGNNKTGSDEIYKRIIEEGHVIGNHTYSHSYSMLYSSSNGFFEDFNRLQDFLQETTGTRPEIMRFPGGSNNTVSNKYGGKRVMNEIISRVKVEGYKHFDWNVSSTDGGVNSTDTIINSVLNGAKNKKKAIVLFHDSEAKTTTMEALPVIIPKLKEMGFHFEVLTKDSFAHQFKK